MVVKIVNFNFSYEIRLWLVLEISNPSLNPTGACMKGIDSVIDMDLFAWFPLREDAIGPEIQKLIVFVGRTREVDVKLSPFDVNNLTVHPFVFGILNIYILPQIKLQTVLLAMHALIKNNYNINTLSLIFKNKY